MVTCRQYCTGTHWTKRLRRGRGVVCRDCVSFQGACAKGGGLAQFGASTGCRTIGAGLRSAFGSSWKMDLLDEVFGQLGYHLSLGRQTDGRRLQHAPIAHRQIASPLMSQPVRHSGQLVQQHRQLAADAVARCPAQWIRWMNSFWTPSTGLSQSATAPVLFS